MASLTPEQALAKMAENKAGTSSQVVKTAPKGQPNVAPVPSSSSGSSAAPTSAPAGNPKVAPAVAGMNSNATSASGQAARDTSPEMGAKGKANTGLLAMTKGAGFAMGMVKRAQEKIAEEKLAALADELAAAGVPPELFDALATLKAEGLDVQIGGEMGTKLASAFEKAAKDMPEFFAKKKGDGDADDKGGKKDDDADDKKDKGEKKEKGEKEKGKEGKKDSDKDDKDDKKKKD